MAELLERGAAKAEVTVEKIVAELAKIGFANMADYMRPNAAGDPYLDFSRLTREQAAALQEVTVEDFTEGRGEDKRDVRRVKFKLYDKRAALVDLGRHLSMFPTKVEMSGKDGGPIETVELSPLEAARRLAFAWEKGLRALEEKLMSGLGTAIKEMSGPLTAPMWGSLGIGAAGTLLGGYGEYRSGMDQAAAIDASRPYDLINAANRATGLKYGADTALAGAQRQAQARVRDKNLAAVEARARLRRLAAAGPIHVRHQPRSVDRAARRVR